MTQDRALKVVTHLYVRGTEYLIVTADHFNGDTLNKFKYAGIKREYVTDGKINRQLNGLQMFVSETVAECIDRIKDSEELSYLIDVEGLDTMEACLALFNKKQSLA